MRKNENSEARNLYRPQNELSSFRRRAASSSVEVHEFTQPVWYRVCAVCPSMRKSLSSTKPLFTEFSIDFDSDLISHTLEYRGCGIRAASYELRAHSWLPEACVWLHTKDGNRKMWVHSFAHCFAAEELTFHNKLDADHWALEAAKSIIDRAFEVAPLAATARWGNRRLRSIAAFARRAIPS